MTLESPINFFDYLPDELLVEIFELGAHTTPTHSPRFPVIAQQQLKTLLVLTSVSARWRNITIGIAQLWTWIVVTELTVNKGPDVGRSMITAFLERSRNRPIDIYLAPAIEGTSPPEDFLHVYEPIIFHLERCSTLHCYQLGSSITPLIFPLPGPMPRLKTLMLMGKAPKLARRPVQVFAQPESLTALADVTVVGIPIKPIPKNSFDKLVVALNGSLPTWTLPLVKSSENLTSLRLWEGGMLGEVPDTRIFLPKLKVLHQTQFSVSPFLDAPALDELHWESCWLGTPPMYGHVSSFPAVTKLRLKNPFPYDHPHPPARKLEFPLLTDVVIEDAAEASSVLRGLLIPHTLDPKAHMSTGGKPTPLPYPYLRMVTLKETEDEDPAVLEEVLTTLLDSYENVQLEYDARETFPKGNGAFWDRLRKAYSKRVFANLG
ncbi:hypothetical protein DL93DRAFT_1583588 [Clavulina sp. PMI_390]|nr:hypothetical protein DL93DRAFT_1583588 [Clavulina sp. PMI_390]